MNWSQIANYVNITIKILRVVKNVMKRITQEFLEEKIKEEQIELSKQANEIVT